MTKSKNKLMLYKETYGLSFRQLADKLGLDHHSVIRLCKGQIKNPKLSTVTRIQEVIGLAPQDYIDAKKK